jgi:hypothetical protein
MVTEVTVRLIVVLVFVIPGPGLASVLAEPADCCEEISWKAVKLVEDLGCTIGSGLLPCWPTETCCDDTCSTEHCSGTPDVPAPPLPPCWPAEPSHDDTCAAEDCPGTRDAPTAPPSGAPMPTVPPDTLRGPSKRCRLGR